jgi:hypothetical protein
MKKHLYLIYALLCFSCIGFSGATLAHANSGPIPIATRPAPPNNTPDIVIERYHYPVKSMQTPEELLAEDTLRFWAWLGNPNTTLSRTNVTLTVRVWGPGNTLRYSSSATLPELAAGASGVQVDIPGFFIPSLPTGRYRIEYESGCDPIGPPVVADAVSLPMYVTGDLLAKENAPRFGLRPLNNNGVWAVGNVYEIPDLWSDTYWVSHVGFAVVIDEFNSNYGVSISLHRIGNGLLPDFSNFSFDLCPLIGTAEFYIPDNSDFTIRNELLYDLNTLGPVLLTPGRYLLMAYYFSSSNDPGQVYHAFNDSLVYPPGMVHIPARPQPGHP